MSSFFLLFIGLPVLEIFLMISIGGKIGDLNTILLIFMTAVVGIYFAKLQGINTMRSGFLNLYQNKIPIYEIMTGASIAIGALLLIIPGFITDTLGFVLLIPFTRKFLINLFVNKQKFSTRQKRTDTLDGEIIEKKKDEL